MSTDFQHARMALGALLRELRTESGLTGRELGARLGWTQSKVSKLENGRQTPSADDLAAWARGTGRPDAAPELVGRLRGLETRYRSWRRQLAGGYRAVQDVHGAQARRTRRRRSFDPTLIPGLLQTPEYAHSVLLRYSALHSAPRDIDAAVRSRVERQSVLKDSERHFHFLMWEGALHARPCPSAVMSRQLERVAEFLGRKRVRIGILPFTAELRVPVGVGFSIHDDRLVITETWHAEMWLDDAEDVAVHLRAWETLQRDAVYDAEAHTLIVRARHALGT
ncbi:helix-turn-helix transcriptional regulator [Streptomyces mobaraensis]|uniref:helix-turn-helix domain-containing protein n=1 Tax=Streptomyces mobaraensis TaxID=35621 RepID=UPI00331F68A5